MKAITVQVCQPECLEKVARTLEVMGQMTDCKFNSIEERLLKFDGLEARVLKLEAQAEEAPHA